MQLGGASLWAGSAHSPPSTRAVSKTQFRLSPIMGRLAEVLGRYSNLSATEVGLSKARAVSERERREEPGRSPELPGASRVRALLEPYAEEIRARYEAGGTCLGLARDYGVPETTMRDFFGRIGIAMRPQGKVTWEGVAVMDRLREAGWPYRDSGEPIGVTRHAVMNRRRRSSAPEPGSA